MEGVFDMKLRLLLISTFLLILTACEGIEYNPGSNDQQEFTNATELTLDSAIQLATNLTKEKAKEKGADVLLDYACEQSELLCLNDQQSDSDYIIPENSEVHYVSNYDSDTVTFLITESNGKETIVKVRVLLINGNELEGENGKPEPLAVEGKLEAERLLKAAKTIRLEYDQGDKKDHYQRHLMHIFLDDKNFQEMMLKTGLVKIAYVYEPNTTYLDQLKKAEKYAQKNKLGLWGDKYVN